MRPISVEFQAFGPYADKVTIDLETLGRQGLFLICGETGSGKTMILDAMTMALYGESSGGGRNSLAELRCNRCAREKDTMVAFTFEKDGAYYRFERKLEMKKVNLAASQNVYTINEEGVAIPLLQNGKEKDVNAKAVELIGLTADQFRQVVILPQGQFEKFLTSGTEEKEQILNKIFNTSRWERIAQKFFDHAKNASDALEEQKQQMNGRFQNLGCAGLDELSEKIQSEEEQFAKRQTDYEAQNYGAKQKDLEAKKQLSVAYDELHKREQDLVRLQNQDEQIAGEKARYDLAQKAEPLRAVVDEHEKAMNAQKERKTAHTQAQEAVKSAQKAAEIARDNLSRGQAKKPEMDEERARVGVLQDKKTVYATIDRLHNQMDTDGKLVDTLNRKLETAQSALQIANAAMDSSYKKMVDAQQEQQRVNAQYMAGISGELAQKLSEGNPCPVCGSIHHPAPATLSEDHVTADEVDAVAQMVENMTKAWKDADQNKKKAEENAALVGKEQQDASAAYAASKANYESSKANLVEGIASSEALEQKIQEMNQRIAYFDRKLQECVDVETSAQNVLAQKKADEAGAGKELEQASKNVAEIATRLQKLLADNQWKDLDCAKSALLSEEEREALLRRCTEHSSQKKQLEEQIAQKQKELQGTKEVPLAQLEDELKQIREQMEQYNNLQAVAANRIAEMKTQYGELQTLQEEYNQKRPIVDSNLLHAKHLRGDTGMGLKRYVLAIMFTNVVAAANEMLAKVHGGRYHLYRSDDKVAGSNKKGLNLKVVDHYSEDAEGRNVATLSGGEKFLVSLSLAIGMSTIAQTSGVRIEAMFIDEGFGSLDQNSIEDALDILNGIREANGLVGIISHVEVLRNNIPSKILVEKRRDTSSVNVSLG